MVVSAVVIHKVGRRVVVGMSGSVRAHVVATVAIPRMLTVMHHHSVGRRVIICAVGNRRCGSGRDVMSSVASIPVSIGVLRVGIVVAISAGSGIVHGRRRIAVG